MSKARYWDNIYSENPAHELGWYAAHLGTSVEWISDVGLDPKDPVIDIGGGASTLAGDLVTLGHRSITVLDLSANAIRIARGRLDHPAISWLAGDVTEVDLPAGHFRLWHDRAVFHFLTEVGERDRYRASVLNALAVGGYLVIGTFGLHGPSKCSGLPVQRYDAARLSEVFGEGFRLEHHHHEDHVTPSGGHQAYVYCLFRRVS